MVEGERIKGSRFYRDFCCYCGEPMRVKEKDLDKENNCLDCDGVTAPYKQGLITRQKNKLRSTS